jgi:hypothetical protein
MTASSIMLSRNERAEAFARERVRRRILRMRRRDDQLVAAHRERHELVPDHVGIRHLAEQADVHVGAEALDVAHERKAVVFGERFVEFAPGDEAHRGHDPAEFAAALGLDRARGFDRVVGDLRRVDQLNGERVDVVHPMVRPVSRRAA